MASYTTIDLNRLDEEWARHPGRVSKAARRHAKAKKTLAEAKAFLEVEEAEVSKRIRKNPGKYGVKKTTEAPIREAVVLHARYKTAKTAVIEAEYDVDIFAGELRTLEHMKKALEDEVFLWGQAYFSGTMKHRRGASADSRHRTEVAESRHAFTRKRKKKRI